MPFTTLGKNAMLASMGIDRVGAFDADAGKSITSAASTDIFTSTAHGYAAGDLVVFSGLTGGAGIKTGYPYFVVATNLAANTFSVSETPGGAIADHTTNVTAGTVTRLVELSGGSPAYARKTIAFNTPSGGSVDDSTNGAVIDVPAGATVDWLGFWNNASSELRAIDQVTPEAFAAQGTYTVTDADFDLTLADG